MGRFYFVLFWAFAISCKNKEDLPPPQSSHPSMKYTELNNREVKTGQSQSLDVDNDGRIDFIFYVLPIGDPIFNQDKFRFLLGSGIHSLLFVDGDNNNNSPIRDQGTVISLTNQPPFEWWEVAEVYLAEKIVEDDNSTHWEGPWKNVTHKYVSIQVKKNTSRYNGWIELSFDTTADKLILHKAGISVEPEKEVKAGY